MSCPCSAPKKVETKSCLCANKTPVKTATKCECPKKCQCEGECKCGSCSEDKLKCTCATVTCTCGEECSCGHCKEKCAC